MKKRYGMKVNWETILEGITKKVTRDKKVILSRVY